jgi:hypothetical protein
MVTTALKMVLWRRDHGGRRVGDGLIHHSDVGSPIHLDLHVKKLLTCQRVSQPGLQGHRQSVVAPTR